MTDRLDAAEMNVAICRALGINPEGISKLSVSLEAGRKPCIEVEYSDRHIAKLSLAGDDADNPITSRWAYELVPLDPDRAYIPTPIPISEAPPIAEMNPPIDRPNPSGTSYGPG